MDKPPSNTEGMSEVEAASEEVTMDLKEVEVETGPSSEKTNIIIKVSTAGAMQTEKMDSNDKQKNDDADNDTKYICEFCKSPVKVLVDCDICKKWACKLCVGVSSVKKMTTISDLTQEARGLFWCCDTCGDELRIKDKELDANIKINLIKDKVLKVQDEEKVEVEDLIRDLQNKEKELIDKDSMIDELNNNASRLTAKLEEMKVNNTPNEDETDKIKKEKDTLLTEVTECNEFP